MDKSKLKRKNSKMNYTIENIRLPKWVLTKVLRAYHDESINLYNYVKRNWTKYKNLPAIVFLLLNRFVLDDNEKNFELFFNEYNQWRNFLITAKYGDIKKGSLLIHQAAYYIRPNILRHLAICKVDFDSINFYGETVCECVENGYKDLIKDKDGFEKFIIDDWYERCKNIISLRSS